MRKLVGNFGKIDVLIDFDAGATKYIDKIKANKKIVWIHSSIPNLKKKRDKIERFGKRLESYDKVVAICDEMKMELKKIYPNLKEKIMRVYNPFNFERIEKLSNDTVGLTHEEIRLLKDNYIIAVSRLDSVSKDFSTLLKAMKILKQKNINKKLYIVGDGPSREEIEKEIKLLKLEKDIKLLGRKKNPYIWIKNSDFFIHSSKFEGFGLVLVEAGSLGKLVISSDCKVGPSEILEYGKSGILFEVGNEKKLANILEEIILKNKYKNLVENMLKNIKKFNKSTVLKEYEKLIDE